MKVEHSYNADLKAIHVKHKGVLGGLDKNSPMVVKIRDLAENYHCTHFLLDAREMTFDRSIIDVFFMGNKFDELGFDRNFIIAFIYAQDEKLYEFLELVVQNRGYRVRFFKDEADAREWLLKWI
jgi:hypothetical protein